MYVKKLASDLRIIKFRFSSQNFNFRSKVSIFVPNFQFLKRALDFRARNSSFELIFKLQFSSQNSDFRMKIRFSTQHFDFRDNTSIFETTFRFSNRNLTFNLEISTTGWVFVHFFLKFSTEKGFRVNKGSEALEFSFIFRNFCQFYFRFGHKSFEALICINKLSYRLYNFCICQNFIFYFRCFKADVRCFSQTKNRIKTECFNKKH